MALLQMHFLSASLNRIVPVTVILPVDHSTCLHQKSLFPTLYLLHGMLGSHTDWVRNTRIQQWAEERGLAVVMPSGDTSFYIDQLLPSQKYGQFIGRELVEMTRRTFPLSHRREDTFLAGLSMGGFGALRNGLKYADTFGYAAGLSSAVHIFEMSPDIPGWAMFREDLLFGDLEEARNTDKNPRTALLRAQAAGQEIPRLYMCCGLQDDLLEPNRKLRDFLLEKGVDLTYRESQGGHDWDYWNPRIREVLDWLPIPGPDVVP